MSDERYTYAVARIRALEPKLLDRAFVERHIQDSASDFLQVLKESPLSESFSQIEDPNDYHDGIDLERNKTLTLLEDISPDKELMSLFRIRYDFHNLKVILKEKFSGINASESLYNIGTIPSDLLKKYIEEENFIMLPEPIKEAAHKAIQAYETHESIKALSFTIDKCLWSHYLEFVKSYKIEGLSEFVKQAIDIRNIKTFLRIVATHETYELLLEALIPGGYLDLDIYKNNFHESSDSSSGIDAFIGEIAKTKYEKFVNEGLRFWPEDKMLFHIDVAADNFIDAFIDLAKYEAFGPEPLFAYLAAKEREATLIRSLFVAKLSGMKTEDLNHRWRSRYA